uniref:Heterogeneous nuclear ribonucleoprotein A0 n=1 Tax=Salmo salar TaxID=8030 RepID=B5X9N1_SALSA|nr:Heterogeneous nuclear ribonucleoprotein A0 [Salmo salar]
MDNSSQLCKLFVGGLNVDTDDDGLRKHFEQYGQLTDCVVVVNKQLQRSRCFGFVTYSSAEEADAAMAARPHVVDGTNVELKRAVAREDAGKPEALAKVKKIFIGGLKDDIEDEHLNEYFSQFGEIEKAEVIAEKETGKKRGFGFVHFTDNDSADKAVVLKFHNINGHKVEVKKALTKQEMQATGRGGRGGRGMRGGQNSVLGHLAKCGHCETKSFKKTSNQTGRKITSQNLICTSSSCYRTRSIAKFIYHLCSKMRACSCR